MAGIDDGTKRGGVNPPLHWRVAPCFAWLSLAALLAGIAAADEIAPSDASQPAAETARLDAKTAIGQTAPAAAPAADLFRREAFDPAEIQGCKGGGLIVRSGPLLRHPTLKPYLSLGESQISAAVCQIFSLPGGALEASDFESIACGFKALKKKQQQPANKPALGFNPINIVVRMSHARDWQAFFLASAAEATLETSQSKNFVQLPEVGEDKLIVAPCLRFRDDRTMILNVEQGIKEDGDDRQTFFDDTPAAYPWASLWRAVDGGLITLLFDNRVMEFISVPDEQNVQNRPFGPLVENASYFALGLDWSEAHDQIGLRIAISSPDHRAAEQVLQALQNLLATFAAIAADTADMPPEAHEKAQQFVASAKFELSDAAAAEQSVRASAQIDLTVADLIKLGVWAQK